MIAGAPGTMKSIFALNLAILWARAGLTGIYFSADSDDMTVARRVGAMVTGKPDSDVERDYLAGATAPYADAMRALDAIKFVYQDLDISGIEEQVTAFEAVYGAYPNVIWIDNAINYVENASDWTQLMDLTKHLNILARETQSHVQILHHTSESASATRPPPRRAIQGKISQIPRLILTMGAEDMALYVSCVKNTNGPQDPEAQSWIPFNVNSALQVSEAGWR